MITFVSFPVLGCLVCIDYLASSVFVQYQLVKRQQLDIKFVVWFCWFIHLFAYIGFARLCKLWQEVVLNVSQVCDNSSLLLFLVSLCFRVQGSRIHDLKKKFVADSIVESYQLWHIWWGSPGKLKLEFIRSSCCQYVYT